MSQSPTTKLLPAKTAAEPRSQSTAYAYFMLTRLHLFPVGSNLFFWPCVWGALLAATNQSVIEVAADMKQLLFQFGMFAIGATLVHSAACVLSDICDKDFDAQVERTKNRPLVTGAVSIFGAWCLILVLLVPAVIAILVLGKPLAIANFFLGVIPLNIVYPLAKRWTWWPQFFLGLAINWGVFVAWYSSEKTAQIHPAPVITLFIGMICWAIIYDTIYACQDRTDDAKAGVKSTALLFGSQVRLILSLFSAAFVGCLAISGILNGNGVWYFAVSVTGAALHLSWQMISWMPDVDSDCSNKFKANGDLGYIIFAGLLIDFLVRVCSWALV